jgi:hypothetical protein
MGRRVVVGVADGDLLDGQTVEGSEDDVGDAGGG